MKKKYCALLMFALFFVTLLITVSCSKDEGNQPPATPVVFVPANNDTNVSIIPTLFWSACPDPEKDSVKYDVYLGTSNPPGLIKSDIYLNQYKPDTLKPFVIYYWKVVAKDNKGNSSASAIWTFTTGGSTKVPGDLAVIVTDATQTNCFGGSEVFLYKTESDRTNDPERKKYYRKTTTDNTDPVNIGAVFYALDYQKYYIFCRLDLGGGNYIVGAGECFVPYAILTKLFVVVQ